MNQEHSSLLMIKHAGIMLGVGETQMSKLAHERYVPYVRIVRGATTLLPTAYIGWLRYFLQVQEQPQATRGLARQFGRTPFAMQVQWQARHEFWELFRKPEGFSPEEVGAYFGLGDSPNAGILQRWHTRKVFTYRKGIVPASQLSAACEWWDMDYS